MRMKERGKDRGGEKNKEREGGKWKERDRQRDKGVEGEIDRGSVREGVCVSGYCFCLTLVDYGDTILVSSFIC